MIAIEKNIPIPAVAQGPLASVYPFKQMGVGDSFSVPRDCGQKAKVAASKFKTLNSGWDYQSSIGGDFIRIWRIA